MKQYKKLTKVIIMMVILALIAPIAFPMNSKTVVQAASSLKLNKKNLTLVVGKSETLTIKGTKKVSWSSSNKEVAPVSKAGKVTAVAAGIAKITATSDKKKYICTVTVIEAENMALKEAPFEAREETFGKIKVVIPKDWTKVPINGTVSAFMIRPVSTDATKDSSYIAVTIWDTGIDTPDYATVTKPYFTELLTADYLTSQFKIHLGLDAIVSDFKTSDYAAKPGMAFKTEYKIDFKTTTSSGSFKQVMYDLYVGTYLVELQLTDYGTVVTPDVYQVGEYFLNSLQITK